MMKPEFLEGLKRLERNFGREYPADHVTDLFGRLCGYPGHTWHKAVARLLDECRFLPIQKQFVEVLEALTPPRQAMPAQNPDEPFEEVTMVQHKANGALHAALVIAIQDGQEACEELNFAVADMAQADPAHCPCRNGLMLLQAVRVNGKRGATHYAGPCRNGCKGAERIPSLVVYDPSTSKVVGRVVNGRVRKMLV
ncbi:MAG: hypothetical protein OEY97_07635 [Nitrospirota bacterium]|nr:hypothetical protein [Nitrospirota bacterium]